MLLPMSHQYAEKLKRRFSNHWLFKTTLIFFGLKDGVDYKLHLSTETF